MTEARDTNVDELAQPEEFPLSWNKAIDGIERVIADGDERLERTIRENDKTLKVALNELRTLVLEHYQRTTGEVDDLRKRVRRIESRLEIDPEIDDAAE